MSALYRLPWFLALSHLSRGAAWSVHAAARSRCEEIGSPVLPRGELHLAFASLPAAVRRLALSALVTVGLWVEVDGGYEIRETPGETRPAAPVTPRPSRPASSAERMARMRAKRASHVTGSDAGQPVTSDAGAVTTPPLSSSLSGEISTSEPEKEKRGMQGGPSPSHVTGDVTGRVTPPAPVEQPSVTPAPGDAPPPAPPPPSAPAVAPAAPRPRRPRPSSAEVRPEVAEVFGYWRAALAPRAELTAERVSAVALALTSGLSVADCKLAIDGCGRSEWHKRTGNTDLSLILRPGKVERFASWGRGEADPNAPLSAAPARPRVEPQPEHPGKIVHVYKPLDVQAVIARRKAEAAAAALAANNPGNPSSKKDAAE